MQHCKKANHDLSWNYPLGMAAWKLGPALATGNTVVLKPAEQTPLSILYFANLIKEAGFPPGVLNIVNGYGKVAGAALASHLGVDKIAFTGSTNTGREIMKMASINMKNITLETGGKSPLVVFDDADIDQAVKWSHVGIMSNMGQICTATSRIFVQSGIYDKFVEAFKAHTKTTSQVGDPFKDETFQGPQVTKAQYERVLSYIESGKSEGASLALGGDAYKDVNGKGFFIEPTVFTGVTDNMKIFREEVFGPFVVICEFKDEEEAVNRANGMSLSTLFLLQTRNPSIKTYQRIVSRHDIRPWQCCLHQGYSQSASRRPQPGGGYGLGQQQQRFRPSYSLRWRQAERYWKRAGRGRARSVHEQEVGAC